MQLHHRVTGKEDGEALIFVHGLFGSSSNWGKIIKEFEADYKVIVVDLRNHGRSFHSSDVSYRAQVTDVVALMDDLDILSATIIGHSMGGKVAMLLALIYPERVDRLVIADIAPVTYSDRFSDIISGMLDVDLAALNDRQEADGQLAHWIPESPIRGYLMQNLVRGGHQWDWRINLDALSGNIDDLMGFPVDPGSSWSGPAIFIHGGLSPYMDDEGWHETQKLFPAARRLTIPEAGHWIYSEHPKKFTVAVKNFLNQKA